MSRKRIPPVALQSSPEDVEAAFYEALREADLEKMMAVWADDEEIVCVHPSGARMIGPAAVRACFVQFFAQGPMQVQVERSHQVGSLSCAIHSVMERVTVSTDEGLQQGWLLATNVYLKTASGWRMVTHHASPGQVEPPVEFIQAPAVLH
jgi:ketosteroid isomerase-like protein